VGRHKGSHEGLKAFCIGQLVSVEAKGKVGCGCLVGTHYECAKNVRCNRVQAFFCKELKALCIAALVSMEAKGEVGCGCCVGMHAPNM